MILQLNVRASVAVRLCLAIALPLASCRAAISVFGAPAAPDTTHVSASAKAKADREIINRIIADWRARAQKFSTLHCVAQGTCLVPKGCYNGDPYLPEGTQGDVPAEDYTHPCSYDWLFDFEKARYRIGERNESFLVKKRGFAPHQRVRAFDGAKPATLSPRELCTSENYTPAPTQPDIYINLENPNLITTDLIVLFAHGTVAPEGRTVLPAMVGAPISRARDFAVHGRAARDGREYIVLRSLGQTPTVFTEYWVDPSRQSAIVHWESRSGANKSFEADIGYQQISDLWLPKTIDYIKYTARPESPPEVISHMKITEILPNAPVRAVDFTLEPKVGMVVWDGATKTSYRFESRPKRDVVGLAWTLGLLTLLGAVGIALWQRARNRGRRQAM